MYLKKRLALLLDLIDGQFRASIANDLSVWRVELVPEQCPEDRGVIINITINTIIYITIIRQDTST